MPEKNSTAALNTIRFAAQYLTHKDLEKAGDILAGKGLAERTDEIPVLDPGYVGVGFASRADTVTGDLESLRVYLKESGCNPNHHNASSEDWGTTGHRWQVGTFNAESQDSYVALCEAADLWDLAGRPTDAMRLSAALARRLATKASHEGDRDV